MFSLTLGHYLAAYHPLESVRTVAETVSHGLYQDLWLPRLEFLFKCPLGFCAPNTSVMNGLNQTSFMLSFYPYIYIERHWNEWYEGISSKIDGHFANDMQNKDIILNVELCPGRWRKYKLWDWDSRGGGGWTTWNGSTNHLYLGTLVTSD